MGLDRRGLGTLADATARFLLELLAAGVTYLAVLGGVAFLPPDGDPAGAALAFLGIPGSAVAGILGLALLAERPVAVVGGLLVGLLGGVGYLVVGGLRRVLGPSAGLSLVVGAVESLTVVVLAHVLVGVYLLGAVASMLAVAVLAARWYDRTALLGLPGLPEGRSPRASPVVWACPPLVALTAALAWATARGALGAVTLGVVVVAAGSVLARATAAVRSDVESGDGAPLGALAVWCGVTLPVAVAVVAGLVNRSGEFAPTVGSAMDGILGAWAAVFEVLFGAVEAVTPFAVVAPGGEGALLAVAPGVLGSAVLLAGRVLGAGGADAGAGAGSDGGGAAAGAGGAADGTAGGDDGSGGDSAGGTDTAVFPGEDGTDSGAGTDTAVFTGEGEDGGEGDDP